MTFSVSVLSGVWVITCRNFKVNIKWVLSRMWQLPLFLKPLYRRYCISGVVWPGITKVELFFMTNFSLTRPKPKCCSGLWSSFTFSFNSQPRVFSIICFFFHDTLIRLRLKCIWAGVGLKYAWWETATRISEQKASI